MNRKELKNLAKKIAKLEYTIQTSDNKQIVRQSQMEIEKLISHVDSLEDTVIIDELVQDILNSDYKLKA